MIYVYYNDDYEINGGIGLKEVETREEAADFISDRLQKDSNRKVDMYKVIRGDELDIKPVQVVTKVVIN